MRFLFLLFLVASACSSSSAAFGTDCTSAGGQCVLGGTHCSDMGPTSSQDCNPDFNPGGGYCCVGTVSVEPLPDAGAADASIDGTSS